MFEKLPVWFRRNAYGRFTVRLVVAFAAAGVSILLSFLPYDTILQAIWVVISSMVMGLVVLRQRLNETDERRYTRLVQTRFNYLINNDPEALNTVFADNLRGRVAEWLDQETSLGFKQLRNFDAMDSLAKNGDLPGQLLLRVGLKVGEWLGKDEGDADSASLENRVTQFVDDHKELLGEELNPGVFYRRICLGDHLPTGLHLFYPHSRLLLSVKFYDGDKNRHSLSLSGKAQLFESNARWESFKHAVHEAFPEFQPVNGGSGPQKASIPFFVGPIHETAPNEEDVKRRFLQLSGVLGDQTQEAVSSDDSEEQSPE